MKISVIGLGKLGSCSAACLAYKGLEVIGLDLNKSFVDSINKGKAPVLEPQLQEIIDQTEGRLSATQSYDEIISKTELTMIIVPTPSKEDGNFSDKYLLDALQHLGTAFKKVDKYHVFDIVSTVSPKTCEEVLIPAFESYSGKKLNKDFGFCYNPEFIALGSVIKDFLNPDLVLIGESDKKAGDMLEEVYKKLNNNVPAYFGRMSLVSAEITKISLNSYVTMKISYANTLANICEKIPGSNIDDITKALGADKRISPFYIKGGISYGGPCFPRDNRAVVAYTKKLGIDAKLARVTDDVNEYQISHLEELVLNAVNKQNKFRVSILGLTYKVDTPVIEESPALKLIHALQKHTDVEILVYDPLAMDNIRAVCGDSIAYMSSVDECLENSNVCIVMSQYAEFKTINSTTIKNKPMTIIDCWRILDKSKLNADIEYIGIGLP